ncbi:MAG: Spy/CpxP family protein refolding chaperone [Pyrinomonadaceae bacterium]
MRKETFIFAAFIIGLFAGSVFSQARQQFTNDLDDGPPNANRNQVMRELGLSRDQLIEIRRINQETRPQKEAAGEKFREAKNALDIAVYADNVDETEVREKLRAVSEAQAEMTRINTFHELQVRKVLTIEQLKKFREFRKKFAERQERRKELPKRIQNRRMRRNGAQNNDGAPPRPPV